jgi:hypothetical protein
MLFGSDVVNLFLYSRMIVAEAFRSGHLPLWDPHTMAGFPLLAGIQAAVFYPPTWACVFLSAGTFWTLSVWAHLILLGIFTNRWLERGLHLSPRAAVVGSAVAMLSGYPWDQVFAGHQNYVWAFPWIFGVLWRVERTLAEPGLKRGVLLAFFLAMLLLAGVPQYLVFLGIILVCRSILFLRRDWSRRWHLAHVFGWLLLGVFLCAPQLFPALELATQMQRGTSEDRNFYLGNSLEFRYLSELVFGKVFGEGTATIGGTVALLMIAALFGRRDQTLLWAGLGLFGVLMALGPHTPLYGAFTAVIPGISQFRAPARFVFFFAIAATALAAMGFDTLWGKGTRLPRVAAAVLAVVAVIQLSYLNSFFVMSWPASYHQWPSEWSRHLRSICGREYRVATAGKSGVIVDVGRCEEIGVDHVGGYDPMMLRRYAELINALRGAPLDTNMPLLAAEAPHPAMDMLGARVWHFASGTPDPSWRRWMKTDFYENPGALPRAWVVNNAVVMESKEERLAVLAKGPWDPRRTVILESIPNTPPPVTTEKLAGTAKVLARRPGLTMIESENEADAYLVLSEAWYPGWEAEVDGVPVAVLPANHLIQTIRLSAGKHLVRFEYHSRFLGPGILVAVLAGLVPVVLLVHRHRRQLALKGLPGAP